MDLDQGHEPHHHNGAANGVSLTSAEERTGELFADLAILAEERATADEPPPAVVVPSTATPPHVDAVRAVLIAATEPLSLEAIQNELNGDDRPHVAEGQIVAALDALGSAVMKTHVAGTDFYALAETPAAMMARAAAVLAVVSRGARFAPAIEAALAEAGTPYPSAKVSEELGAWVRSGVVVQEDTALGMTYEVAQAHAASAAAVSTEHLLRRRFSELLPDPAVLLEKAEKTLAVERDAHQATKRTLGQATARIEQLVSWFHTHNIPVPGMAEPRREVFTWSQQRKVTPAEMKRISGERRALRIHRENLRDKLKSDRSSTKEGIDKTITKYDALEAAEGMGSYLLTKEAYRAVVDGKFVVYSADPWDFGAELDREDVPAPVEPTSAPPLIQSTSEIAVEAGKMVEQIHAPVVSAEEQAVADASAKKADEAAAKPKGPKGRLSVESFVTAAEELLTTKRIDGIKVEDAVHEIASCLSGRVTVGQKALAQQALDQLLGDGKVVERMGDYVLASFIDPGTDDAEDDDGDDAPKSGEQPPKRRGRGTAKK